MKTKNLLLLLAFTVILTGKTFSQSTFATNASLPPPIQFLGFDGTGPGGAKHLDVKNNFAARDIRFFINTSGTSGTSTQAMVIKNTAGFVGIGNNFSTPNQLLTLNSGNVNVQDFTVPLVQNNGYMIGNQMTLWRGSAGSITNIFVGANAGASNLIGQRNTFAGDSSGYSNTSAPDNTFVGFKSGFSTTANGRNNVFVGSMAGQSNTTGRQNTFVGYQAGLNNITITPLTGEMNTFIGNTSGRLNRTGANNTFLGDQSGPNNRTGNNNVLLGRGAGNMNTTGSDNTIVGTGANMSDSTFTNASAIGSQAIVTNNNMMILGNNRVYVGIGLSGITPGPQNCLEIVAHPYGSTAPTPNASGLRFRQLTASSPPVSNPGPGVLALNSSGDVIYVPSSGAGNGPGNTCGATPNPLINNWEIPLNGFNYVFTGQGPFTGYNVGIGTTCSPIAKLEVRRTNVSSGAGTTTGAFVENSDDASGTRIGIQSAVSGSSVDAYGFLSFVTGSTTTNYGGSFSSAGSADANYGSSFAANDGISTNIGCDANVEGSGSSSNFGIRTLTYTLTGTTGSNYGLQTQVSGAAAQNYGSWNQVTGAATTNYGVYANASGGSSNYGVFAITPDISPGVVGPDYAGYFSGDLAYTGDFGLASDFNLKQNIDSLTNAMVLIKQLKPKTFEFKTSTYPFMNLSRGPQMGLIAQEVETVVPEIVRDNVFPALYDSAGVQTSPSVNYKSVDYVKLIPLLIEGMKEQQSKIDSLQHTNDAQDSINSSLQSQLNTLADMINTCCYNHQAQATHTMPAAGIDVELKDIPSIVLEQNVPNPFAEQTTISYFLPETVVKAQILFYNAGGKLIQTVELKEKGKGQLNVFASDLSNGIYSYTLVADGKIIETKRMLKQ
jgi:hypothetical protein